MVEQNCFVPDKDICGSKCCTLAIYCATWNAQHHYHYHYITSLPFKAVAMSLYHITVQKCWQMYSLPFDCSTASKVQMQMTHCLTISFVRHTARDGRNVALKWQLDVKSHLLPCLIIQNNHPTINSSIPNNFHANWQNDCVEKNKWRLLSLREFQNLTAEASIKGPWYGEGTNPKPDQEYGKATRLYRTMPRIQNGVYIRIWNGSENTEQREGRL